MAPSAIAITDASGRTQRPIAGPPKLFTPKETQFEGHIEPQVEGYRKARIAESKGNDVAIVIDNGMTSRTLLLADPMKVTADMIF